MNLHIAEIDTPLGPLTLGLHDDDSTLCAAAFREHWAALAPRLVRRFGRLPVDHTPAPAAITSRFTAYFAGDLEALDTIAVDPGGTPFQAKVWAALRRIPAGRTASYAALGEELGARGSGRAVGAANAANPVWIAIPCHRVIGADGSPRGYAGGLPRKLWLLAHEGVATSRDLHA